MSMVTATSWVPRGYAAAFPTKYVFDDDEYGRIAKLAKLQLEDAEEDLEEAVKEQEGKDDPASESSEKATNGAAKAQDDEDEDDDLKEYDLEHYDEDEEGEGGNGQSGTAMGMFANIKSLAYHESNADDPYITLEGEDIGDEEREELQILPTDNLLLAARIEDEVAHLEVYVYEDEEDNLYVHHDIMLPAYPLCVEWLNSLAGKSASEKQDGNANFVAIGTMDPDIEVWDLDMVDAMYPNAILGQGSDEMPVDGETTKKKKKGKKRKKNKKPNDKYHVDSVLSLAGNRQHRNLLASSSADSTVKLWDLHTTECAKSYDIHTDKVCSIAWNPKEATALLSGSYDQTVVVSDMRAPGAKAPRWKVESDVETVKWDPHQSELFYVSTEAGFVHCHDVRKAPTDPSETKAMWSLQAHDESVSSFDVNPIIPGFLVTGSTDREVKLWNVQNSGPSMVVSRNLEVGKVFSTMFAPDQEVGFRVAVAGSKGTVQIWDTSTNAAIRRIFADRLAVSDPVVKERFIRVRDDNSESGESNEDAEETRQGEQGGGDFVEE